MQTNPTLVEIDRLLGSNKFSHFAKIMWPAVSADPFVPGYHFEAITEHLQAVAEGRISRLVINVAIRHSKSLLCSVLFPAWLWVRDPANRIITGGYSKDLAVRDAVRTRQLLESELFRQHFGHIPFVDDGNRKDYYQNTSKGHRLSVSIGSRTAGFDADVIVADDIHDFATRTSKAERDAAIDYFETGLMSRFVNKSREKAVICGHRIHEDDVYSRLRAKYGDDGTWTWLVLPEEYTPKFTTWHNAIGWRDKREEGELLWPERFGAKVIEGEKKRYRHEYSAIFSQEPTPAEGTLFKAEWFRYYRIEGDQYVLSHQDQPVRRLDRSKAWRIVTVDTAISTESGADYTVAQCWDVIGPYRILVAQLRKRLDGNRIVPALAAFYHEHQPQFVAVEKEFVGKFVIDQLRAANVPVKAFSAKGHGDKEQRAVALEIEAEAGRVWFPAGEAWTSELEREWLGFPHAAHDDTIDAGSMMALVTAKHGGKLPEELTPDQAEAKAKKDADERFQRLLWQGSPY